MERLSSGKRINSAADDAAGMAVASTLRAQTHSLDQAIRNANDAISYVNTYDGAAAEVENMLVRMRELSTQISNGTYSSSNASVANEEFKALQKEIDRIANTTTFNTKNLTNGSGSIQVLVGASSGSADYVQVTLNSLKGSALGVSSGSANISSQSSAHSALTAIDGALKTLATARATAGALINRFTHTVSNLMNVSQRQKEALSGMEDTDYATESANVARGMVLAQAGAAMLAQANQQPQFVLALLRG